MTNASHQQHHQLLHGDITTTMINTMKMQQEHGLQTKEHICNQHECMTNTSPIESEG